MMRLLLIIAIILFTSPALAKSPVVNDNITITSDTLVYERSSNKAVFSSNVHAVRGKVHIYGDKMTVLFNDEKDRESKEKIKNINITGNVKIITENEQITAKSGVYDLNKGLITLTQDVELTQNNNIVYGDKLIYDVENETAKLSSNSKDKRVKAKIVFDQNE